MRHMRALRVKAGHGVSMVVDHLQLSVFVEKSVSPFDVSLTVPLFVSELSVVPVSKPVENCCYFASVLRKWGKM